MVVVWHCQWLVEWLQPIWLSTVCLYIATRRRACQSARPHTARLSLWRASSRAAWCGPWARCRSVTQSSWVSMTSAQTSAPSNCDAARPTPDDISTDAQRRARSPFCAWNRFSKWIRLQLPTTMTTTTMNWVRPKAYHRHRNLPCACTKKKMKKRQQLFVTKKKYHLETRRAPGAHDLWPNSTAPTLTIVWHVPMFVWCHTHSKKNQTIKNN